MLKNKSYLFSINVNLNQPLMEFIMILKHNHRIYKTERLYYQG